LNSLRIGCVKYLNARPLIRGWLGDVEFDHPSALCARLASRELDLALVSSFEYLRDPIYQIVDDVSISSDGAVYSVIVAHLGEFSDVEQIELDPASQTAINLTRCLLGEFGLAPRLIRAVPGSPGLRPAVAAGSSRARLLIGDQAIRFRQEYPDEFEFWDLGEQWKKLTGLPFVYALWLIRPEVTDAKQIANRLRALRDENLASLDHFIGDVVAEVADDNRKTTREFLDRYYRKHLRFNFGEREKQGLQTFANLCAKHGVLRTGDRAFGVV
jgi:chorismate dehydratase